MINPFKFLTPIGKVTVILLFGICVFFIYQQIISNLPPPLLTIDNVISMSVDHDKPIKVRGVVEMLKDFSSIKGGYLSDNYSSIGFVIPLNLSNDLNEGDYVEFTATIMLLQPVPVSEEPGLLALMVGDMIYLEKDIDLEKPFLGNPEYVTGENSGKRMMLENQRVIEIDYDDNNDYYEITFLNYIATVPTEKIESPKIGAYYNMYGTVYTITENITYFIVFGINETQQI